MEIPPSVKNLLKKIFLFSKKKKKTLYIVGGYLRDALLNKHKENLDIDFCLKNGAIRFGHKLARQLKAGFVVLDKEHGAVRLVKKIGDKNHTLDFTDFRAKTLEEDLKLRDFTINTFALSLDALFGKGDPFGSLVDPRGAAKDLKKKIIRLASKKSFDDDALRILRAYSFACMFNFKIEPGTLSLIRQKKKKLNGVSGERIRDELFKIFACPDSYTYLKKMDDSGVLMIIFPEIELMRNLAQGPYHHLDVLKHTLETIRHLEIIFQEFKENLEVRDYLNECVCAQRQRFALMKLAALLHDMGKPQALRHEDGKLKFHGHEKIGLDIAKEICARLKLSNNERHALEKMVLWHLRPGYLADQTPPSARAIFRYFRDTGQESLSILLISLADQRATKGPLTTRVSRLRHEKLVASLIKEYFNRKNEKKLPRLLTGDDLLKRFKLTPSPLIGKILREVEELQAIGKIKSKKEALVAASRLIP
jgi:putative nucleotidyltransferase with HDIG domain